MAEGLRHMPGGFTIEDGARVAIHPESDGIKSFLRDARQIRALGEETPDKAIGIFIATTFRGAIGRATLDGKVQSIQVDFFFIGWHSLFPIIFQEIAFLHKIEVALCIFFFGCFLKVEQEPVFKSRITNCDMMIGRLLLPSGEIFPLFLIFSIPLISIQHDPNFISRLPLYILSTLQESRDRGDFWLLVLDVDIAQLICKQIHNEIHVGSLCKFALRHHIRPKEKHPQ